MARRKVARPNVEYPTCVRHAKPRKDVRLRLYFLCDGCTRTWTREAFDNNSPLWRSESIRGYCQLCNRVRSVRLRCWFLCDICDRVAKSIGRNHVAEKAIMDFWHDRVQPDHPHLMIEQNDVSSLRPRRDTDVLRRVLEDWHPPTMGFRAVGLWWADIFTLDEHFRDIRMRRDEQRGAAYFSKKAFQEIDTLSNALISESGELALVERLAKDGIPAMYHRD